MRGKERWALKKRIGLISGKSYLALRDRYECVRISSQIEGP
jgi:hypothetical protein